MKKSFMTRALAMGLSLAMAFSLSAATNVSVASAASKPAMASKQFAVRVGGAAKSYKASAATQKSYKITKATVGNTDKATVKVNSSKKSIKVTPGTVTGTTVVTVTFKNIKTAKSTAKKYRCVVKAAIEPEKPVEPEVVKATKITEAKVSTAKTVTVTFDGVVDTTSATSIKLMRGSTEATVTAAYASDAKSVTLTSTTPLAAGTYTLTVGSFEPVSFNVVKQTPTKLQITSTTVANTDGAGVGFQVLDQYGEPMTDYTAKKLVVTAYNATKGHSIKENVDLSKPYFTLDCATQDVNGKVINALGDKISVVAYLKDNASVSTTAELTITNIYMESLEFGEPELGKEKRVTVNKTYKLPYTAKTNEGNNATFAKVGKKASTVSRPFGDYTFVTSNISALDMGNIEVDKDGNMFFTAGGTAGTAVITAINTKTGTTVSTTIVVNDVPTLSRLDVADASIAWNAANNTEVKAAVTAYDQFDEVIDAKDIKNIKFDATAANGTTKIDNVFASVTRVPNDTNANIEVNRFSNDGKYLIYKKTGTLAVGRNITFNFTSAKTGANGYITFKSIVEVNDRIEPGALTIVTEPDATKQEGQTVKVQFSVLDQYQNKVNLTASGSVLKFHADRQDAVNATDYLVEAEYKGAIAGVKGGVPTVVAGSDNKVGEFEFNLNGAIGELYKDGEITLKLTEGGDQIDAKKFAVKVVSTVTDYDVATDKTAYKAGDTVTVTVNAYSNAGGLKFNRHYNGKHDVEVELYDKAGNVIANSKTRKTLEFKDGVATFTMTAGAATAAGDNRRYYVKQIGGTAITNAGFFAAADGFTVATNSSNKISVDKALDKLRIVDSQGNKITAGTGTSYATVVVKDETLGKDITSDSKIVSNGSEIKLNDKTAEVILAADKVIDKIAGVDYNLSTGFSIDAPATSANSNISISITVDGCTWKGVEKADTNGDVAIKDAGAVEAAAVADIQAFLSDMTTASKQAVSGGSVNMLVTPTGIAKVTGDAIVKWTTGASVQVATKTAITTLPKYTAGTTTIDAATVAGGNNVAEGDVYTFTIEFEIGVNDTNGALVVRKADVVVSYTFTGNDVIAKVESATLKN